MTSMFMDRKSRDESGSISGARTVPRYKCGIASRSFQTHLSGSQYRLVDEKHNGLTSRTSMKLKCTLDSVAKCCPADSDREEFFWDSQGTSMKATTAFHILTTVMSGSATADDWATQHVQGADFTPRADLDLGACLDVETVEELSQNLYNDADTQPQNAWLDNVIEMTSSTELTSSGEHAGIVPNSEDLSGVFSLTQNLSTSEGLDFSFMDSLTATDNATFISLDMLTSAPEDTNAGHSSAQAFSQLEPLKSAPMTSTTSTISTIDLTSLEQFMTLDVDMSSKQSVESSSSNMPTSLWNLDLTLSAPADSSPPVAGTDHQGIKETLKNRLYSRGSLNSVSQDSDVMACSTHSLSSSTSSPSQSFEDEEDPEDPLKSLEKREKNRLAAQKCRSKKRDKTDALEKNVSRLEQRQERLKEEVQKLRDERETLEEIINVHGMVCPKIRKISNS